MKKKKKKTVSIGEIVGKDTATEEIQKEKKEDRKTEIAEDGEIKKKENSEIENKEIRKTEEAKNAEEEAAATKQPEKKDTDIEESEKKEIEENHVKEDFSADRIEDIRSGLANEITGFMTEDMERKEELEALEKKKMALWKKILIGVSGFILLVGIVLVVGFNYFYGKMNIDKGDRVENQNEIFDKDDISGLSQLNPEDISLDSAETTERDKDVINILLAGEEAIGEDRGRTDSIMIATINCKEQVLRLTSIMRDTYVAIPGFSDNKINAAYHNGGMPLLKETIKQNFGIQVDGYILVNFDSFEKVIDAIGGIDIELSEREVSYLNSTNYISDYTNHNLVVGINHMNGNQALGYARVRYVEKGEFVGDFARTYRHRTVIQSIYDKYKEKSTLELASIVPELLPMVTTDLSKSQCIDYLMKIIDVKAENQDLETLNVPVEGACRVTSVRGMSIILPDDLQTNVKAMKDFIYGNTKEKKTKEDGALIIHGQ